MSRPVAITREVSPSLAACELTHLERVPIDVARARVQHSLYIRALADAGYLVEQLPAGASANDMPDSVFVEDIAIVFDELAIVTRPGAASRRTEVLAVAQALGRYRTLARVEPPATLDGGDVLVAGSRVFVGRSSRTNADAVAQLRAILQPHGYSVCEIPIRDCLHLKSAATAVRVGDHPAIVINPEWISVDAFQGFETIPVDPSEPAAANVLQLRDRVVVAAAYPRTADRLAAKGMRVVAVDASELAKAEGAVTCCSLIVERP